MLPTVPTGKRLFLTISLVAALLWVVAIPAAPPAAKRYEVQIRYRLAAARNDRLAQFDAMTDYLKALGFEKDPGPEGEEEDPSETRMSGTIPAAAAPKMLGDPRIKSILLMPPGFKVPEEPEKPVKVQVQLAGGLEPDRQQLLANQVLAKLTLLGFRQAAGYDRRGSTRLVGTIPAVRLQTLLKDLRWEPSGWLAPDVPPAQLPTPLRNVSPILVTEVIPEPEDLTPAREPAPAAAAPPSGEEYLLKTEPRLRELATQEGLGPRQRMEVILNYHPVGDDRIWRRALAQAAPGSMVEGRVGPLVAVTAFAKQASGLAQLPFVSVVRLPWPAATPLPPPGDGTMWPLEPLRAVAAEHGNTLRYVGQGRVAIIGGDFQGYEKLIGKQLPVGTRYVDLTAPRNANLLPDPFPTPAATAGPGARFAAAVAAPGSELTLVRIDPAAPYQFELVARLIGGEDVRPETLTRRADDLTRLREELNERRLKVVAEREAVLDRFINIKEWEYLLNRPEDKLTLAERKRLEDVKAYKAYEKNQADYDRDEREYKERLDRYVALTQALRDLKGIRVVASSLAWTDGYPLAGGSLLNRYFEERPFRGALWFQAAAELPGQTWSGLFRDVDGNGLMEFAPTGTRLPPGRWTPELNFLGWHPFGKPLTPDLPDKARMRVTIQWREPHDPAFWRHGEDVYQKPLANLRLVVLRQRDPSGARLPVDDLEVVAASEGLPQRIDNQPGNATYEQAVEFTVDPAGRYALQIEGRVPSDIRPAGAAALPGHRTLWELRPRVFVDVRDEPSRRAGRPMFLDFGGDPAARQPVQK